MGRNRICLFVSVWLWMGSFSVLAQTDSLLRQADRLLSYKAYGRAIDAYSQLLSNEETPLTNAQKARVQGQLAQAYKQVGDGTKAERYFRESISNNPGEDPQQTLQYAQTLAGNGKFQEAQQQYERYLSLKAKTPDRVPAPIPTSERDGKSESTRYRLEYLALNSKGEEFSPAFYQDGLVYVYGTKGGSTIETTGKGGGAGYLDLQYVPNRKDLKATSIINADGSAGVVDKTADAHTRNSVGKDYYTRPTANDSPTVPNFSVGTNVAEGLGYEVGAINPAQKFGNTLNTRYHEGPATFSRDGSQIYFTRNNYSSGKASKSSEGVNKLKLYTARQQNGAWADIEEMPFNSDEYSVGHPTLSRDGQRLYFASDMPGGFGGTDLYVTQNQNGRWGKPVNLGNVINTKGNELFPFVDDAGNLYFSTDGRRGQGGLDIFYASMVDGTTVQEVTALEAPINSPKDDFGLITDARRQGGYFSSNRREGNDDIYRFVRESSLFDCRDLTIRLYDTDTDQSLDSTIVVVKAASEGRPDQTLTTDKDGFIRICLQANNEFMFQSSRDGYINATVGFTTRNLTDDQPSRIEMGMFKPTAVVDTIQVSSAPVPTGPLIQSRIRGTVVGERDRRPIEGVTVRLRNECDQTQREYVTGPDGHYMFDIVEGCDYTLAASKPAFGTNTNRIKRLPKKTKPKEVAADLRMLTVGDVLLVDNIYYDFGGINLRADGARELEKVVTTMRKYPTLVIEIRSYTDSRGEAARNLILSQARAEAVAKYLTDKGISRKRITAVGLGETQLVNNCTDGVICTEAEHQRNRRTEFRVVDIK